MEKDQDPEQIIIYSDSDNQGNPQSNLDKQKQQVQGDQMKLRRLENGPIQMLYIMFTFYRKQLQTIAISHSCEIRIAMSTYFVGCRDESKGLLFLQCLSKIGQFAKSINYVELFTNPNPKDVRKYSNSPHVSSILNSKNIFLINFNNKVYGFSRQVSKEAIKDQFMKIVKRYLIFTVRFRGIRNRPSWYNELFTQIELYIQQTVLHYSEFFKERNILVELDKHRTTIHVVGQKPRFLMESKQTMKNALESLVCIIVKNTKVNEKTLKKFLQKAAGYPIHFARYRNKSILMISKDNIFKQILKKSQNIMKYIGFDQQNEQSNEGNQNREIGIYVINSSTFDSKIKNVRQSIKDKGFDIYTNLGVKYLQKVFSQNEQQKTIKIYQQLLVLMMTALEQKKEKHSTISKLIQKDPYAQIKKQRENNPLKYWITEGRKGQTELSTFFRRDVLAEKVQMKKQYLIAFNVIEGKEQIAFWILQKSGQIGAEVLKQGLTQGRYMQGRKCTSQKGVTAAIYDQIITLL